MCLLTQGAFQINTNKKVYPNGMPEIKYVGFAKTFFLLLVGLWMAPINYVDALLGAVNGSHVLEESRTCSNMASVCYPYLGGGRTNKGSNNPGIR